MEEKLTTAFAAKASTNVEQSEELLRMEGEERLRERLIGCILVYNIGGLSQKELIKELSTELRVDEYAQETMEKIEA